MTWLSHMVIPRTAVDTPIGIQKTFNRLIDNLNTADPFLYIPAWDNGVPGDGTNQTTALQAIVNALPTEGGMIALKGDVQITSLNLNGRQNITFMGMGGEGAGGVQGSYLRTGVGAVGGRVIDARGSIGIGFRNLWMGATNTAFDAIFIDFSGGAAYMSMLDCYCQNSGDNGSSRFALLNATILGEFSRCRFSNNGVACKLAGAGGEYSNQLAWIRCDFSGGNGRYPVDGSGNGLSFIACNFEADTTGKPRAFQGSSAVETVGLSMSGCTFFDATAGGTVWVTVPAGSGLSFTGNFMGGYDPNHGSSNYAINLGGALTGINGFEISGNSFQYMTAGILFDGTIVGGDNARAGKIAGNSAFGGVGALGTQLAANVGSTTHVMFVANEIDRPAAGSLGQQWLAMADWPVYVNRAAAVAAGLVTGDVYADSTINALGVV